MKAYKLNQTPASDSIMNHSLKMRKLKGGGYSLRKEGRYQDVARVYEPGALRYAKLFCASEDLEQVGKKILPFLEVLYSADTVDPNAFKEQINKKYIKDLCKELSKALKRTE